MITDLIKGARYATGGFALLNVNGVRRYIIVPLLINVALFALAIRVSFHQTDALIHWLLDWLPDWLDWLSALAWLVFGIITLIVVFYSFAIVANFVGSPFNGILSEKLEQHLTGNPPPSNGRFIETLRGIQNAVISELRKLAYLVSRSLPLLIISFIPAVNVIAPALWFIFGAWMLALEYLDYPMGNHGFSFREQREVAMQKRGVCLGFGIAVVVLTMIPLLNLIAMPVAVAGATRLWVTEFATRSKKPEPA